ncbi:MAG: [FeFe] hydrogenase H-cluster radical SAM maturase HydG, partial [Bacteriovoracia bacterium]
NLIDQGHKRLLLVAGEAYSKKGLDYVLESIDTVYKTTTDKGNIRRLNVNIAPLEVEEFKRLHEYNIGTYQLFQETYHRETYKKLHLKGPKANYDYRLDTIDRAFQGGFDDVGIGILFGLYDWRYEILALLSHIKHLEKTFGIGPHTISVPRLEPALNSDVSYNPPYPVSDRDFKKIIAVLRLAVPYTGIILSTRESREMRVDSFDLGVSQISAGSKTNPGGYDKKSSSEDTQKSEGMAQQFSLGDTRPLQEVIKDIVSAGYIPSFCTGCYRLGRVGKDFMDLAKPGLIKRHCLPNAIFSFAEYMENFSDQNLKTNGYDLIQRMMENDLPQGKFREKVQEMLNKTKSGEKDIYL